MTECTQSSFGFQAHVSREVVARFDGGTISSDGGSLLLREADRRLNLLPRLADCFLDGRSQKRVDHSVREMLAQRIYGLALGYEDINDHEQLRRDPLFGLLAGRKDPERALAGKSTLNRLELGSGTADRYKKITFWKNAVDELLVNVFIESQTTAPERIVLDLDTTDLTVHGKQEGRFFHGYYDSYCYLPLYIMCGDHVLCARLREANQDAAAGSTGEVERSVGQLRAAWPETQIILCADSGFCREALMRWCEDTESITCSDLPATCDCGRSSVRTCGKPVSSGSRRANRRVCSPSSSTRRSDRKIVAGAGLAEWSPRPSISTARKTHALWSPRSMPGRGRPASYTRSITAGAATWRTASRNSTAYLPVV